MAIVTITRPIIVNHFDPSLFKNVPKMLPNFADKKATIKNLKPRAIRQIKKNIIILKLIIPLVIVKTLNGNGVKPARNKVANHKYKPVPEDKFFLRSRTSSS